MKYLARGQAIVDFEVRVHITSFAELEQAVQDKLDKDLNLRDQSGMNNIVDGVQLLARRDHVASQTRGRVRYGSKRKNFGDENWHDKRADDAGWKER